MERGIQGHYETISTTGDVAQAFLPLPLPPDPPIDWGHPGLHRLFQDALLALGRLNSQARHAPDTSLLLYAYIRKEAVLSSMIEGTQSTLSDLLLFELDEQPGVPTEDVQEVSNYVAAMNHGIEKRKQGLPLTSRLIREMHEILLSKGRGSTRMPGEFRRSQNWIGGTNPRDAAFVPPPPGKIQDCMGHLEVFLNDDRDSPLLKAALAHVQFETIHPFLDGNGRIGRLLITLVLFEQDLLTAPLLYLSLYFKSRHMTYYNMLNSVRSTGNWEHWLRFFCEAVLLTAGHATKTLGALLDLAEDDGAKIKTLGRAAGSAAKVHRVMQKHPISTAGSLVNETGLTPATVNKSLAHLEQLGIVRELTARKRNRVFSYHQYIEIMNQATL